MAEPIGAAPGLLALAAFALQSSGALYQTIKSFQSHQSRVAQLLGELGDLNGVLSALTEVVNGTSELDFSDLKLPLLRCGNACKEFEAEVLKCAKHSGGSRTSFRDWAKLRYMSDDLGDFKESLAAYKSTVNVALTSANL
jgi:Fungal N-terminal domain of STAND proteins